MTQWTKRCIPEEPLDILPSLPNPKFYFLGLDELAYQDMKAAPYVNWDHHIHRHHLAI
jgi:hypothetical protein